jgi:hypothetical protein
MLDELLNSLDDFGRLRFRDDWTSQTLAIDLDADCSSDIC